MLQQGPPQNPELIRFTQETISRTLSKPKPGETTAPHLDALAALIERGEQSMMDFPPCEVFGIFDREVNETTWFSLNNRKLYIARKSHAPQMPTRLATFDEIVEGTWKMSSASDGHLYPRLTSQNDKECQPTGLLAQFRAFVQLRDTVFPLNRKADDPESARDRLLRETTAEFRLICNP